MFQKQRRFGCLSLVFCLAFCLAEVSYGFEVISRTKSKHEHIKNALKKASIATGTDYDYLMETARRESGLRPNAKARTSSATGLFQFIESTWLKVVKNSRHYIGLGQYAKYITKTSDGRYVVLNPSMRRKILDLRKNPEVSAVMAGVFTRNSKMYMTQKLGRNIGKGELYIAHFLGANGAVKLITAAERKSHVSGAALFPKAARANKNIFYHSNGAPKNAKQVYANLISKHNNTNSGSSRPSGPLRLHENSILNEQIAAAYIKRATDSRNSLLENLFVTPDAIGNIANNGGIKNIPGHKMLSVVNNISQVKMPAQKITANVENSSKSIGSASYKKITYKGGLAVISDKSKVIKPKVYKVDNKGNLHVTPRVKPKIIRNSQVKVALKERPKKVFHNLFHSTGLRSSLDSSYPKSSGLRVGHDVEVSKVAGLRGGIE